jgi:hypothetical protein
MKTTGNIVPTFMITCGKCVSTVHYPNETHGFGLPCSKSEATEMAMKAGWQQGQHGWTCPPCLHAEKPPCPDCKGEGEFDTDTEIDVTCRTCGGTGHV